MLRHPSVASASGTLLWHPALTSCYDILLRQAEGLRMEHPPRQYHIGSGHFGASSFLLRLECAPFNSPLHLSKHSCSSFNSASFSPKVSPRSRCPPHVFSTPYSKTALLVLNRFHIIESKRVGLNQISVARVFVWIAAMHDWGSNRFSAF